MKNGSEQQSMLARLLSKENITVQHGKYSTAFFDIKNRVLGLPIWKDKGKDVYDLLTGHEVGHALYTPSNGLDEPLPCQKDYLNIVEDVRIERMIQSTYPGLVGVFRRAYSILNADNFFGTNGKDIQTLAIGDRVNLKAKLGTLVNINFSDVEKPIVNQVMAVKTWEDVVAAAIALQNLAISENAAKKAESSDSGESETRLEKLSKSEEGDPTLSTQSIDAQIDTDADTSEEDKSDKSDNSKKDATGDEDKSNDPIKEKPTSTTNSQFSKESNGPVPEIITNSHFEQMSKTIVEDNKTVNSTTYAIIPSAKTLKAMVIPYKTIFASRHEKAAAIAELYGRELAPSGLPKTTYTEKNDSNFRDFISGTKKFVGVLSKEFEMRKAAYQYSRATVSQTGILNVNKLHGYKVTDDIFLSVTQLANAKNHGMMMFIDYSYSMNIVLPYVLKHVINLSLFCKSTGIPFQVYGFTGDNLGRPYVSPFDNVHASKLGRKDSEINVDNVVILDLINSKMPKLDFDRAIRDLYNQSINSNVSSKYESLGNTPLNETIIAAHILVSEFKQIHNIQKMTTVFLTDGEGQNLSRFTNSEYDSNRSDSRAYFETQYEFVLNGRRVCSANCDLTEALIKNLRITTGIKAIGFFIPSNNTSAQRHGIKALQSANRGIRTKTGPSDSSWLKADSFWKTQLSKEYKKNKSVNIENAFGYDQYFVVASGVDLDTETEDLEIDEGMTRAKMAKAFSEFSKSKQINRVFVSKFAQTIS